MAIIKYKPTSPGRRFMTVTDYSPITTNTPERLSLIHILVGVVLSGGFFADAQNDRREEGREARRQSLRHGFAVPPPFAQGRLWCGT